VTPQKNVIANADVSQRGVTPLTKTVDDEEGIRLQMQNGRVIPNLLIKETGAIANIQVQNGETI
jgi:hypothetical protein